MPLFIGNNMNVRPLLCGVLLISATVAIAATSSRGDGAKGKVLFAQCMACHSVDKTRKSGIGPNLAGVVGRPIASIKGFAYSPALSKKKGIWTASQLDAYLAAPAKAVPGGRMPYPGMRNPADRNNLIAYLALAK